VEHFSRLAYVFNPDSFKNIDKLIQHFIEIERYDKAIEFLKKLEELYPDSKNVLLINKRSYQRMKYDDISKEYSQKYEAQFYFENIVKEQLSPEQEEKLKN